MDIYEQLELPTACRVGKTIFKKTFLADASLTKADRKLFDERVGKIVWQYCLKPANSNIRAYKDDLREYPELEILEVTVRDEKGLTHLAELILRAIPYPMLLFFRYRERFQLWLAQERINQADPAKNMMEETLSTEWLAAEDSLWPALSWRNVAGTDFFAVYTALYDAVSCDKAKRSLGCADVDSGAAARQLLEQAAALEQQIAHLRAQLRQETQFNRKMELNIAIKRLLRQREALMVK